MRTFIFLTITLCLTSVNFLCQAQIKAPKVAKKLPTKPVNFNFDYYELFKDKGKELDTVAMWRSGKKVKTFDLPGSIVTNYQKGYVKVKLKNDSFEESHNIVMETKDCIKLNNGWRWYKLKDAVSEGMALYLSDSKQWIVYRKGHPFL